MRIGRTVALCSRDVSDQTRGLSGTGSTLLDHLRCLLHLTENPREPPEGGRGLALAGSRCHYSHARTNTAFEVHGSSPTGIMQLRGSDQREYSST